MRTFVAVFPSPEALEALEHLRAGLEPRLTGVRWSAGLNLHFTLRFLGELDEEQVERAGDVVEAVTATVAPFELVLAGAGVFPGWNRPRILWAGTERGSATLEALARTLDRGFRAARLGRADKPFRAHLTLGRWRVQRPVDGATVRTACEGVGELASFRVTEVGVIRSTLTPRGPVYEAVRMGQLRAAPPPVSPEPAPGA